MQQMQLLHTLLEKSHAIGHASRRASLLSAVGSVINGANLSLTSMGRYMDKEIKPRSKIHAMDYLLSNGQLHAEIPAIFRTQAKYLCGQTDTLNISVDWSGLVAHKYHLLRASIDMKGNAMTLYEEIHPESKLGNAAVQGNFLKHLANIIPNDKKVCIITDAGFGIGFFKQVEKLGWDYLGRLLTNMYLHLTKETDWIPCKSLYERGTSKAKKVGKAKLSKKHEFDSILYLNKKQRLNQKTKTKNKRKVKFGAKEKNYKNTAQQPWLIATSLDRPGNEIMRLYALRMKIEHDFRDTKDPVHGLGLRRSRSVEPMRLAIQLMIGNLARLVLWLTGLCLEEKNLHYDFQANSLKNKRVLSLIFLALEAIRSGYMRFLHKKDFATLEIANLVCESG